MDITANPNVMMVVRYAITAGAAFAVGKGWIGAPAQGALVDGLVQLVGVLIAVVPPLYAALKVDNGPKKP
jgi:hypothetical protein